MQTAERTYSFRAAGDFGQRLQNAFGLWRERLERPDEEVDAAAAAYLLAALKAVRNGDEPGSQSALLRAVAEAFVSAAEKIEADDRAVRRYRSWAEADTEAHAVREGTLAAGAERWRDE